MKKRKRIRELEREVARLRVEVTTLTSMVEKCVPWLRSDSYGHDQAERETNSGHHSKDDQGRGLGTRTMDA